MKTELLGELSLTVRPLSSSISVYLDLSASTISCWFWILLPVDSFDNTFYHVSFTHSPNSPPESHRVLYSDRCYCLSTAWLVHHMFSLITSIMMIHSFTSNIPFSSEEVISVCISDHSELGRFLIITSSTAALPSPSLQLAELDSNLFFWPTVQEKAGLLLDTGSDWIIHQAHTSLCKTNHPCVHLG